MAAQTTKRDEVRGAELAGGEHAQRHPRVRAAAFGEEGDERSNGDDLGQHDPRRAAASRALDEGVGGAGETDCGDRRARKVEVPMGGRVARLGDVSRRRDDDRAPAAG